MNNASTLAFANLLEDARARGAEAMRRKAAENSELTDKQRTVYRWVRAFIESNGWPPTRRELADAMGYKSANAAEDVLRALEKKGAIRIGSGGARRLAINPEYTGRT